MRAPISTFTKANSSCSTISPVDFSNAVSLGKYFVSRVDRSWRVGRVRVVHPSSATAVNDCFIYLASLHGIMKIEIRNVN
jgi:hypothetical protein